MDGFRNVGKHLKKTRKTTDFSLKRPVPPQVSQERIREVFDFENPVKGDFHTPNQAKKVLLDVNFGQRLPSLACCGDCFCGITESYTSDSLIGTSLYLTQPYVLGSVRLWINGTEAVAGVDYLEYSPGTGELRILWDPISLANQFTISYVYTVGNCTEAVCIDNRFECLGYTFISGLATVFSDRFDRSELLQPSGGCGYYFTTPGFVREDPFISGGVAFFGSSEGVWLGGVNRLVGKAVEVLAAIEINPTSGAIGSVLASFQLTGNTDAYFTVADVTHNSSAVLTKVDADTIRLTVSGSGIYFTFDDAPFSVIDTRLMSSTGFTASVDIDWSGDTRYWFRYAQFATGEVSAKVWPQGTLEPTGAQVTTTIADSYATNPIVDNVNEVSREEAIGTINYLRLRGSIEAIMVGAGLDNGDWGINGLSTDSGHGYYCGIPPNYPEIRFGYDCALGTGTPGESTVFYGNNSPQVHWTYSYAQSIGGNPPPTGDLGALQDYDQGFVAIDVTKGYPDGLRLTGKLVGVLWDNAYIVEVKKFPAGPLTMGGANGIQGGQTLGSYTIPKDGTPIDMDVFVPVDAGETYVRIGLHVPNIATLAQQQPYYFAPFLFPNNFGNDIRVQYLRADGIQSVQCTTGPFCDDCSSTRCPNVVDSFDTDTATRNFGTGDFVRTISDGGFVFNDKGINTKIEYIGGTVKVSFQSTSGRTINFEYNSPFDCYWEGSDFTMETIFDMRLVGTSGEVGIGNVNWDVSAGGIVTPASFSVTPSYSSTNITTNAWWSVKYRTEGLDLFVKTWLAGTSEPTTWSFTGVINSFSTGIGLFATGPSSFTAEFRNITSTKVV